MHFFNLIIFTLQLVTIYINAYETCDDSPIVSTDCGQIRGKTISQSGKICDAFLGVPFAAPPIGDLRFEKPQPPKCWTGIRESTEFGPICIQAGSNGTEPDQSEDCLYLNVFVPKNETSHTAYPVMVFIHGGGFVFGSAKEYGDNGICENLASRGVIIVTIQYRLNLYGFLTTASEAAVGNYALWDQIWALNWVQRNIANFGGDPDKVTIFGESAGGASVSFLTYTPVAEDLFHQSIAESGSALATWAEITDSSEILTRLIVHAANCSNPDDYLVIKCLQQLSVPELQFIYNNVTPIYTNTSLDLSWSFRVDGELFNQTKLQELNTGKPAITGVNSLEWYFVAWFIPFGDAIFNSTLDGFFPGNGINSTVLKQTTRYVYIDSFGDRTNLTFVTQQLAKLISDNGFRAPAALEADSKTAAGSPVWTYKFDYYSKNVFPPHFPFEKGATHAHELCYLFLKPLPPGTSETYFTCPGKYEGDDRVVANYMGEIWTNFAIYGDPSSSSLKWPQYINVTHANTMHIHTTLDILPDFYLDVANFWNYLVPNIEKEFDTSDL